MTAKQVLVTGAAGFIGRHLVAALLARGDRVMAHIHRRELPPNLACHPHITVSRAAGPHELPKPDTMRAVNAVCHVAAFIPDDFNDSGCAEACMQANAIGALRMAELAMRANVARYIHFSTAQMYRDSLNPADENAPVYPATRASFYLGSKLLGELFVEHLRVQYRLPATIFRVASCYGPGMSGGVVKCFIDAARAGKPLRVRDRRPVDFVYVDDVVAATLTALDMGTNAPEQLGIFNLASGRSHTLAELADAVRRALSDRQVAIIDDYLDAAAGPAFAPLAIEKAQRVFGFRPRGLRDGITEMCGQLEP